MPAQAERPKEPLEAPSVLHFVHRGRGGCQPTSLMIGCLGGFHQLKITSRCSVAHARRHAIFRDNPWNFNVSTNRNDNRFKASVGIMKLQLILRIPNSPNNDYNWRQDNIIGLKSPTAIAKRNDINKWIAVNRFANITQPTPKPFSKNTIQKEVINGFLRITTQVAHGNNQASSTPKVIVSRKLVVK